MKQLLNDLGYVKRETFIELEKLINNKSKKADLYLSCIAKLIRFNTLLSVARAGTGHLGASLSMIELLTEIYFRSFEFNPQKRDSGDRDIFILSKGHGAPGLYAALAAKGFFETSKLNRLRRIGGLAGHCDLVTPGIEANTGSLAMGLSKAVGFDLAKKRFGLAGRVIVVVGDGELQEGQCWEAFLSAASFKLDNLYIIIDDNRVQTDLETKNIVSYGDLDSAWTKMGFTLIRGEGRQIKKIHRVLSKLKKARGQPKLFHCLTLKGQGISYMEYPNILKNRGDKYIWHNKAPNALQLKDAFTEIFSQVAKPLHDLNFSWDLGRSLTNIPIGPMQVGIEGESLVAGFAEYLKDKAKTNKKIVVFDADLEEDCGFIPFHQLYPKRFFEMGIMEQHLASTACSFARLGFHPVIATYAAFLTARANEQLYNLASEKVPALIVGNMAGILPATPGKSHQAFRDISLMKNIPGIFMYQPATAEEVKHILERYFAGELGKLLYLRLSMATSAKKIFPADKKLQPGVSQILRSGQDAVILGIGPVILGESLAAADSLKDKKISVEVRNHPWLTVFDKKQFKALAGRSIPLLIIEDHYKQGGFGESLLSFLSLNNIQFKKIKHLALNDFPATGFRQEALEAFCLDRKTISSQVENLIK